MLRNYLLIALRNLWRNKWITGINLVGMAIGFGIFLTFWSWVRYDLSFDRFHRDIDQMYVLFGRLNMDGAEYTSDRTGGVYASFLKENFPQILSSCRVSRPYPFELGVPSEDKQDDVPMQYYNEDEVLAVDSTFLEYYSFRLLQGNRNLIFTKRDHMVITESLAERMFGDKNPMDRAVRLGEGDFYTIVGVVEDPPVTSSIQFKALLGFHVNELMRYPIDETGGTIYYTHCKLAEETDLTALNRSINELIDQRFDLEVESYYYLDSFTRVHLYGETRSIVGLYMNMILALVILFIACINFINLTTAYASTRIKEITIRKSAGASKRQLVIQFMGETYLLLLLAFYLGLFIAEHLVPETFRVFGVEQTVMPKGVGFWIQIFLIFLATGMLAGLYPAVKIAGFKPLAFLSGMSRNGMHGGVRARKVLIVVQFTFSILLILVSVFMVRQYNHLKEADLGFNREDVLYIRTTGKAWEEYPQIKTDLREMYFVEGVSSASAVPVWIDHGELEWGEREGDHNKIAVILWSDPDFTSTFQIDIREGSYFTRERDSLNYEYVVVNQSLVDVLGWEDPVGRTFYMWGEDLQVLGVVENFDFFPFNLNIFEDRALIIRYDPVREFIFVRLNQQAGSEQIASIEAVFQKHNPGYEFLYDYVSNYRYEALESAEGIKFITILFSILAILIAAMGLIGLSLHNSNSRTKEVGIRKAMGANTEMIMRLLLSDFVKLVILSNLIGIPLGYLIIRKLFQLFSYRVDIQATVFIVVFILSVVLALVTVTFHALRTARANPVNSLRYE